MINPCVYTEGKDQARPSSPINRTPLTLSFTSTARCQSAGHLLPATARGAPRRSRVQIHFFPDALTIRRTSPTLPFISSTSNRPAGHPGPAAARGFPRPPPAHIWGVLRAWRDHPRPVRARQQHLDPSPGQAQDMGAAAAPTGARLPSSAPSRPTAQLIISAAITSPRVQLAFDEYWFNIILGQDSARPPRSPHEHRRQEPLQAGQSGSSARPAGRSPWLSTDTPGDARRARPLRRSSRIAASTKSRAPSAAARPSPQRTPRAGHQLRPRVHAARSLLAPRPGSAAQGRRLHVGAPLHAIPDSGTLRLKAGPPLSEPRREGASHEGRAPAPGHGLHPAGQRTAAALAAAQVVPPECPAHHGRSEYDIKKLPCAQHHRRPGGIAAPSRACLAGTPPTTDSAVHDMPTFHAQAAKLGPAVQAPDTPAPRPKAIHRRHGARAVQCHAGPPLSTPGEDAAAAAPPPGTRRGRRAPPSCRLRDIAGSPWIHQGARHCAAPGQSPNKGLVLPAFWGFHPHSAGALLGAPASVRISPCRSSPSIRY